MELQGTHGAVPGSGQRRHFPKFPPPSPKPLRSRPLPAARARPSTWNQKKNMLSRQQAPTSWSSVHVQGHPGDFPGAWVGHATK